MRRASLILALALTSFVVPASPASAGEISGQVLERSGGRPVPSQAVRLRIIQDENEIAGAEAITDLKGTYRFRDIDTTGNLLYVARVKCRGVLYNALPVRFPGSNPRLQLPPFRVYATTGSLESLEAGENVVLQFESNDIVRITETVVFTNRGDRAYAPEGNGTHSIEFSLLRGGFDFKAISGLSEDSIDIDSGRSLLLLRTPILPGDQNRSTIRFSYAYRYRARTVSLSFSTNVARTGLDMIVRNSRVIVDSAQLEQVPSARMEGLPTIAYSGGPFKAGEAIAVTISGLWRMEDVGYRLVLVGLGSVLLAALWIGFRRKGEGTFEEALNALEKVERDHRAGLLSNRSYARETGRLRELLFQFGSEPTAGKTT